MSRALKLIFLVAAAGLLMGGCSVPGEKTLKERNDFAMDTYIIQKVYGDNAEAVMGESLNRINEIDEKFSAYNINSDISYINRNAGVQAVEVSTETKQAFEKGIYFSQMSGGAYDLTVGPLVTLWDINSENPHVPPQSAIADAVKLVGYNDLVITGNTIKLNRRDQAADLGSVGKGIACDAVAGIYKKYNTKGIISVGGSTGAVGTKPDGSPWKVGVRDPRGESNEYIGILSLADKCAATSGDYERYFEDKGKRYHHILDPVSGYPSDSGLISVTIVADSGADCDALSTACFVLGREKGTELLEKVKAEGIFIDNSKNVYVTGGLKGIFQFTGEHKGYKLAG